MHTHIELLRFLPQLAFLWFMPDTHWTRVYRRAYFLFAFCQPVQCPVHALGIRCCRQWVLAEINYMAAMRLRIKLSIFVLQGAKKLPPTWRYESATASALVS